MAHGAGAGMAHPFMASVANDLAERGIATLRYQFPYMERGSKRPDPPKVAQATVRAAVAEASRLVPGLPLFAGGKSFGGRMTSQAQAASPLPGVRGLVFLGFPLHPPGKPSDERAAHLSDGARFRCCSCRARATSSRTCDSADDARRAARRARHAAAVRRRRSFVSCARAHGAQGFGSPGGTGRCAGGVDRTGALTAGETPAATAYCVPPVRRERAKNCCAWPLEFGTPPGTEKSKPLHGSE